MQVHFEADHVSRHRQGAQGKYDTAPKHVLSSAFPDQKDDEDIIQEILKKGDFQTMEVCFLPYPSLSAFRAPSCF